MALYYLLLLAALTGFFAPIATTGDGGKGSEPPESSDKARPDDGTGRPPTGR